MYAVRHRELGSAQFLVFFLVGYRAWRRWSFQDRSGHRLLLVWLEFYLACGFRHGEQLFVRWDFESSIFRTREDNQLLGIRCWNGLRSEGIHFIGCDALHKLLIVIKFVRDAGYRLLFKEVAYI